MPGPVLFPDDPWPIAFAHRGGAGEAPENSWSAFERALSLGYRYMETDVRVTADGVAVAFHDPTTDRVLGCPGPLSSRSWADLQRLQLPDGRGVPRFDELLSAWPEVRWNVDLKQVEAVAPAVEAIRRAGCWDRVLLASFSGRRTALARSLAGRQLPSAAGRLTVAALVAAKVVPGARVRCRAVAAQVPLRRKGVPIVGPAFVRVCHRSRVAVHVWTIDDAHEMERLLDLGVDGIMTDRPSVLKEVLVKRGSWGAL